MLVTDLTTMLQTHQRYLLLDASSPQIQAGLWYDGRWTAFASARDHALESLFATAGEVCATADCLPQSVHGYLFCEGPGSVLGIRLAAMAIRTWRALNPEAVCLAYQSLHAAGQLIKSASLKRPPHLCLIAESRQRRWNVLDWRQGDPLPEYHEIDAADWKIPEKTAGWYLPQRQNRLAPPPHFSRCDYDLSGVRADFWDAPGLLRAVNNPDACCAAPDNYIPWTAERHR